MEDREEYLEQFGIDNEKMMADAAQRLRENLGESGEQVERLLKDKKKIMSLVNGLSNEDFSRLKQVLDNPQIMERVLGSDKAKKNLARILGEL